MLELIGIAVVVPVGLGLYQLHRAREANRGRARQWTLLPCMQSAQITVDVWQGNAGLGVRLDGVRVEVIELGLRAMSQANNHVTFTVRPGAYSVRAAPKGWFLPRQAASAVQNVAANGVIHFDLELDSSEIHLHVDADRDGVVDPATAPFQQWVWGPAANGGQGAVVVVNNDTDGNPLGGPALPAPPEPNAVPGPGPFAEPDNDDGAVNTAGDVDDLAPFELRRDSTAPVPQTWNVTLSLSDADAARLRVFHPRAALGVRILGPGPGGAPGQSAHRFQNINVQVIALGMEATQYPSATFDGIVVLVLTVSRPADGFGSSFRAPVSYVERAEVRVAPWMVFHHLDPAVEVYVANLSVVQGGALLTNVAFSNALQPFVNAAGCGNPRTTAATTTDGWMQDCMEIGYTSLPLAAPPPAPVAPVVAPGAALVGAGVPLLQNVAGGGPVFPPRPVIPAPALIAPPAPVPPPVSVHSFHAAARMPRGDDLNTYPKSQLAPDFGFLSLGPAAGNGVDCGGNLEATPPVRSPGGDEYPWGRLYYSHGRPGEDMHPDLRGLLEHQVVQPPVVLDATWLAVNHVDEMISFVPAPSADRFRRFHVVVASPRRAYELLWDATGAGHGAVPLMQGRMLRDRNGQAQNVQVTVDELLGLQLPLPAGLRALPGSGGPGGLAPTAAHYLGWNQYAQQCIDAALTTLAQEIEIPGVVEIPMLFVPYQGANAPRCEALTAGSVNMLVINGHCIVPEPSGPVVPVIGDIFQRDIQDSLQAIPGLTVRFIDDWAPYHDRKGDVHCGTNTRRIPLDGPPKWWEFEP